MFHVYLKAHDDEEGFLMPPWRVVMEPELPQFHAKVLQRIEAPDWIAARELVNESGLVRIPGVGWYPVGDWESMRRLVSARFGKSTEVLATMRGETA